jgi:hypothetical protein
MEKDDMDIFHLHKKHEHRIATRENYYKGILKKCWNRINMISSLHSYTTSCIFQIPDFVIGIPPHDMKDCSDFILNSLETNGFKVERQPNNYKIFHISWDKKDMKYLNSIETKVNNEIQNDDKVKKTKQNNRKNNYKGIDEYKPTGSFLYEKMWDKVDQNNKLLFSNF